MLSIGQQSTITIRQLHEAAHSKAIDWETQDFTGIPKELAWDKIDLKKAAASETFALDVVDWATINNNDKAAKKHTKQLIRRARTGLMT